MTTRTKQSTPNGVTDARKVLEQYVFGASHFMEIPVAQLKMDMSYQREFAETLVGRIVSRFDFNKYEPITVNARSSKDYYIVDGGHRKEAARRLGIETLTCRVIKISPDDEAGYFIDLNRQRRWVTPVQHFKAELRNGNPAAIEINRILESRGLRVASSHSPQTVSCTGTLHKVYAKRGAIGLQRVMDIALAWPDDEPRRFAGQLLQGVDLFCETQPRVDFERLRSRLGSLSTGLLLSRATARWHGWRMSDQRGGSLVDATAEEIKKQYLKR
jgi:hypothetical protein